MPRKPRQAGERYYAWRRPRAGEEALFEILVGWRWTAAALLTGCLSVAAVLAQPAHRRLRALRGLALAAIVSAVLALLEGFRGAAFPAIKQVDLPIDRLPEVFDGLKIAQLSDLHLGTPPTGGAMRRAVAAVQAAKPDLIALTGDYVSYSRHLPLVRAALRSLSAPYGIYAIFGNHDHWTHPEAITQVMRELGIHLLVNEHRTVSVGTGVLVIAGVDDIWDGHPDLAAALTGAPPGAPVILLAHAPDYADTAAQAPVAVQLAGHTHAGHIRLPGLGPLFLPRHGVRYHRGLHRVGQMWLYVCQGIGGWPIRIGSRAEVTVFTLRRTAEQASPRR